MKSNTTEHIGFFVENILKYLKEKHSSKSNLFKDIIWMIDKEQREISALEIGDQKWILCIFHFLKSIGEQINQKVKKENHLLIIEFIFKLRNCCNSITYDNEKNEFYKVLCEKSEMSFLSYFRNYCDNIKDNWTNIQRVVSISLFQTNNCTESLIKLFGMFILNKKQINL